MDSSGRVAGLPETLAGVVEIGFKLFGAAVALCDEFEAVAGGAMGGETVTMFVGCPDDCGFTTIEVAGVDVRGFVSTEVAGIEVRGVVATDAGESVF